MKVFLLLPAFLFLGLLSYSQSCTMPSDSATLTWFNTIYTSGCSFSTMNTNDPVVWLSSDLFYSEEMCGACLELSTDISSTVVKVDGECTGCPNGHIDVNKPAYDLIAPSMSGNYRAKWTMTECPFATNLQIAITSSSNPWYFSATLIDHLYPVSTLEFWNGTNYNFILRNSNNQFEDPMGIGSGPFQFRISDIFGHVIEVMNVPLSSAVFDYGLQFDQCANPSSIGEMSQPLIRVYPNPANSVVYLLSENKSELSDGFNYWITDLSGKQFSNGRNNGFQAIDISSMPAGFYFMNVNIKGEVYRYKIVKE